MLTNRPVTFLLLLFLLPLLNMGIPAGAQAQNQVIIENADRAEGFTIEGNSVRKLLGNVVLSTDQMRMEADSAYQFIGRNQIHAFNIQIETDEEIIWADTLFHNTFTDFSQFRGRVIIESNTNTVFGEVIDLISPLDLVIFRSPVRFEDEDGVLLAESGTYFQEADSAAFRGNVQLADTAQYIEADSLFMNRSKDLYEMNGRVFADDFEENVTFEGEYLLADSTGYRLLRGSDAWLMELSDSKTDTTHLLAKKIELIETDTSSTMDAYRQVRIWSTKFSAVADTANYRNDEEMFVLRGDPILWQDNIQLSGPLIEATLEDDELRFLQSFPQPFIVQQDSATGRLNQMTGDTLHAHFSDGSLDRLVVFNSSEIIFHQKDENDTPDGVMEMIAAGKSTMTFQNGEFDFFKAEENIDGSYLPESPENAERKLDNFTWNPNRKPQRPNIRVPRLDPITDERPFDLPPRYIRYLRGLLEQVTPNQGDVSNE
ncbi:MAG: hypothetical protein GVY08_03800 [Bacteroidetes bacterium]|nr:hypothetical protein [Bacteroidota bacterium]